MNTAARAIFVYELLKANPYYPLTISCIQKNMQERQISMTDYDIYNTLYALEDEGMVCAARSEERNKVYWALSEKAASLIGVPA